jgi:hypothetical protein
MGLFSGRRKPTAQPLDAKTRQLIDEINRQLATNWRHDAVIHQVTLVYGDMAINLATEHFEQRGYRVEWMSGGSHNTGELLTVEKA